MKVFCNKKKALAFVCVLVFFMLVIPFTALPVQAAQNLNVGDCYRVDSGSPIIVDGKMDEAYTYGTCMFIDFPVGDYYDPNTYGVAYFVWSGNSIYCYVIVNDADIVEGGYNGDGTPTYWQADCVELYIHRGDDVSRDYPLTSNEYLNGPNMPVVQSGAHTGRQSARQYRIDGYSGAPSCYLFGEDLTYSWNEEKGRFYHEDGAMVTDDLNAFGWNEGGFASNIFETGSSGYAVEYKIDFETPLQAGEDFRFDLMISDRFWSDSFNIQQANIYYSSTARITNGPFISNINYYDHFTLRDTVVYNDDIIDDEDLYNYGRYVESEWPDDPDWPDDPEDYLEYDFIENGVYYLDNRVVYCDPNVISVSLRSDTVGIDESAFAGCLLLEEITIPSGVTSIGDLAFAYCVSLTDVTFKGNGRLTDIGEGAFAGCILLKEIAIPSSVTSIGDYAFEACLLLRSVVFDENSELETIGTCVFYECSSLTELVIPSSVTTIDPFAFDGASLEDIYYVGTRDAWTRITHGTVDTDATLHYSVCYWGHNEVTHKAKAPTCTDIGWDAYVTCSRCDYTTYVAKAALGHSKTQHEAKAPTCTDIGWDAYVTCSRCDYTTYAVKPALDHDKIAHEAKAPTCTEIGWDAYETCSRCNFSTYQEKPADDHDWDSGTVTVQQTCTTPLVVTYSCQNCEEERVSTLNNGALLPHSYTEEIVSEKYLKSPATESEGAVYYKSCACGETGTETFTYGDPLPSKSGCGGSLHGTEIVLLGLALVTALYTRKARKRREN